MASELEEAACTGDVKGVMRVFGKAGVDPSKNKDILAARLNITDVRGETALHLAVRRSHMVAIQTLVHAGAGINCSGKCGDTPLLRAIITGRSLSFIQELILLGADINCVDGTHRNALMLAVFRGTDGVFQHLIETGADIHCVDMYGMNAVMLAAERGEDDCLRRLIKAGAKIHCVEEHGQNAVILAAIRGQDKCLKLLIKAGADINFLDRDGMNALMWASFHGHEDCLNLLIKAGADLNMRGKKRECLNASHEDYIGPTALTCAAERHQLVCLKLLLKAGADADILANRTKTPRLFKIVFLSFTECVRILIDHGADVNIEAAKGETALMILVKSALGVNARDYVTRNSCKGQTVLMQAAVDNRLVHLLTALLKAGAVVDQQDSRGMTALAHAVSTGSDKCVDLLLNFGSDTTKIDDKGQTVLMHAAMNNQRVRLLPTLVKAGVVVDQQDFSGMTALTHAVSTGSYECVRWLVDYGASVNIRDHSGKTLLHYLKFSKHKDENATKCSMVLLSKQVDVNSTDKDGMTPLMYVARARGKRTMAMLLEHGADITLVDNQGQTAFIHFLTRNKNPRNIQFLLDNGADLSIGKLASGKISALVHPYYDVDLTKLHLGNQVDLEVSWKDFVSVIEKGHRKTLLFLLINGVTPSKFAPRDRVRSSLFFNSAGSLLQMAVTEGNLGITKYFLATCYLQSADLNFAIARSPGHLIESNNPEIVTLIENVRNQPWPLVKLCFVAVSTLLGASPGRQERVKNSQLPPKLQNMLLFQEPWSRLCVHQWDKIPLTFSPEKYEKLPHPRPLLYHWPVGRGMVPCDCGECDGTMHRYDTEEEVEENKMEASRFDSDLVQIFSLESD